jgi:hypothetical protein
VLLDHLGTHPIATAAQLAVITKVPRRVIERTRDVIVAEYFVVLIDDILGPGRGTSARIAIIVETHCMILLLMCQPTISEQNAISRK